MTPIRQISLLLALGLLSFAQTASAGVYKCVAEDGGITYTQTPCPNQVSTAVRTSSTKSPDESMDCKHANKFALGVARSMKSGRGSADTFARYGGIEGISKSAVNIINYVYVFQHSRDVTPDRIAALTQNKCKARSFGLVNCEAMPYDYIEKIGGCDPDEEDDDTDAPDANATVQQTSLHAESADNSTVALQRSGGSNSSHSSQQDKQAVRDRCRDRLQNEIDGINATMRSGYTSAQGEKYRERLRTLRNKMQEC